MGAEKHSGETFTGFTWYPPLSLLLLEILQVLFHLP